MDNSDVFPFLKRMVGDGKENDDKPMIRLTKLEHGENPKYSADHPRNVKIGFSIDGIMMRPVTVGDSFYVGRNWATSVVQEILSENIFKTMNSTYKWEVIK
jgi:hypothetical protein